MLNVNKYEVLSISLGCTKTKNEVNREMRCTSAQSMGTLHTGALVISGDAVRSQANPGSFCVGSEELHQ